MGTKEFQVDVQYIRSVDELTELVQTTFETNAALALRLVEKGRSDMQLNDDQLVFDFLINALFSNR